MRRKSVGWMVDGRLINCLLLDDVDNDYFNGNVLRGEGCNKGDIWCDIDNGVSEGALMMGDYSHHREKGLLSINCLYCYR